MACFLLTESILPWFNSYSLTPLKYLVKWHRLHLFSPQELTERLRRLHVERESLNSKMEAEKHVMRAQLRDLMDKQQAEVQRMTEQHQAQMAQTQQDLLGQLEELRRAASPPSEEASGSGSMPADSSSIQRIAELEGWLGFICSVSHCFCFLHTFIQKYPDYPDQCKWIFTQILCPHITKSCCVFNSKKTQYTTFNSKSNTVIVLMILIN